MSPICLSGKAWHPLRRTGQPRAPTGWRRGVALAYVWFKLSNLITPLRVSAETELVGLNAPEMGALGYPDFTVSNRN